MTANRTKFFVGSALATVVVCGSAAGAIAAVHPHHAPHAHRAHPHASATPFAAPSATETPAQPSAAPSSQPPASVPVQVTRSQPATPPPAPSPTPSPETLRAWTVPASAGVAQIPNAPFTGTLTLTAVQGEGGLLAGCAVPASVRVVAASSVPFSVCSSANYVIVREVSAG